MTIHEQQGTRAQHTLQLDRMLFKTETGLHTFLKPGYERHFKDSVKDLELPKDNPLPFALYIKGQVALLWAATDKDYDIWTKAFMEI